MILCIHSLYFCAMQSNRIIEVLIVVAHHQVLDYVPVAKSQLGLQIIHNASLCLKINLKKYLNFNLCQSLNERILVKLYAHLHLWFPHSQVAKGIRCKSSIPLPYLLPRQDYA